MRSSYLHQLAAGAMLLAGVLWGASFIFAKFAFAELSVSHVVFFRFALASLVLFPLALMQRMYPRREDIPLFVVTGFLNVPVTFMLQLGGLSLTTASSAALIIGCLPALMALAGTWLNNEQLRGIEWTAVGISTLGVGLIVGTPGSDHNWLGDGLVFLSLLAVVGWVTLSKRLMTRYSSIAVTAYIFTFGSLIMLPIALFLDGPPKLALSPQVWFSVIALGLLCTGLTYGLWNWGLQYASMSHAGVYVNMEPLSGALLGIVVLNEAVGPGTIIGGVLILLAATLVSRQRKEAPAEPSVTKQLRADRELRT